MSAQGPPTAQHNGPPQPQPSPGYRLYPSAHTAHPAFYSQVPSKVAPTYSNSQYGADYYSSSYAASSQNPLPQPMQASVVNTNQDSQPLYQSHPQGHHIAGSQGPGTTMGPSAAHVPSGLQQPYPSFAEYAYMSYPASSCPPQGLSTPSGQYSSAKCSPPYPGSTYSSMPVNSNYGQTMPSQSLQAIPQVNNSVQKVHVAGGPSMLHRDLHLQSATPTPAVVQQHPNDGHLQNHGMSLAPKHIQSATVSAAFHMQGPNTYVQSGVGVPSVTSLSQQPLPDNQSHGPGAVMSHAQSSNPSGREGIDESSSTTSSASSEPKNYDVLEGGGYTDTPPASSPALINATSQSSKPAKPFGHGYPSLQPGYQNSAPQPSSQSSTPVHHPGYSQYSSHYNQLPASLGGLSLHQAQQPEGLRPVNLIQDRNLLPATALPAPAPNLNSDLRRLNCSPDAFRCTLTNIPQTQALLNKAKLPLGLLLHPFQSKPNIPVISPSSIVRCRSCRTYINPFVSFIDQRRWKCNLCYRVNDVPEEFMYNPVTRSYGEPHKRPEVLNASVEFIASSDYMLRPPPPAVYLFVLDVSYNAVESGYLKIFSQALLDNLNKLPGDSRTKMGFITFDSTVHFYNLQEGLSQPQMLVVSDIDDIFLPTPDGLLVNLHESMELIKDLLTALPSMFNNTRETHSALGPALQGAFKLMSSTGGRISVFQSQLPSVGAGLLQSREDPNQRSSTKGVQHLGPATDFYKKLALDCSGQQTAVDLFLLSSQYSDLASLACVSKYSAGCMYYYPSFHHTHNAVLAEKLKHDLDRYLTRKIGFEAVMRIRCTKGLSIHTFYGNLFVRSTDLLSLANINEDAGFAVQMSIEESLTDTSLACFQVALLYTSSKGQRRIRVHTLCLPVVNSLPEVFAGADVQAVTCLLANMAVDRSVASSLSDARDALVNAVVDSLSSYNSTLSNLQQTTLIAPHSLRLFPLYILALLKQKAFRTGTSTRLDDRVFAMCQMKYQPLVHLMKMIHPNLYRVDRLTHEVSILVNDCAVPQPSFQSLSAEKLSREGAFLMDAGTSLYLWVGRNCDANFLMDVLGFPNYASVPQRMTSLPELNTLASERMRNFISWLKQDSPLNPILYVIKDDSSAKTEFFQHLVEDRTEAAFSYYEFLLHIQQQVCK
ncbi:protein transport protein Sec24B isoform X2 [Spea bombifrons]|uniref:protein transport protein Sec24B isoform X2 n=1 Tax=Spea bombifrons TaxID=233779 RepID=UPI00234B05F2|nr:protein transport protein Sec24B isoform X2 [Spea bombifrons]